MATIAGKAETIGTKELPSFTILLRTLTASPRRVTDTRITRPGTSFLNRPWSTRIKRMSTHKKLIRHQKFPPTMLEKQFALHR